ncbi:MAG TPA: hypothetical protein V6D20_06160, partial [Candidatus Obscuribacterales bacterium]
PDDINTKVREFQNTAVVSSRDCLELGICTALDNPPGWVDLSGFSFSSSQVDTVIGPVMKPRHLAMGERLVFKDLPGVGFTDSIHVLGPGYANELQGNKGITNRWLAAEIDETGTSTHPAQYAPNNLFECETQTCPNCEVPGTTSTQCCSDPRWGGCGYRAAQAECISMADWTGSTGGQNCVNPTPGGSVTTFQWSEDPSAQNYGYCMFQAFGLIHQIGGIDGAYRFPGKPDTSTLLLPQSLHQEGRLIPNPGMCCSDADVGTCTQQERDAWFSCSNWAGEATDSSWDTAFAACIRANGLFYQVGGMLNGEARPTVNLVRTLN